MVSNLTVKVGADIAGLQKELQKATGQLNGFSKGMNAIGTAMAGAFAVGSLVSLGKGILDVTSEFQKFEAVLTNTLGSKSAAKFALDQIQQFAAKTPFQVNELTAAFVKLANQGFTPTMQEMTSLGDLASAMGKSFDQLTEAIIDAQTGEFERLKEFGIRAQKQGDKVTFTFKGVKKQVDFTAGSIREYILSLGQAEGVSGGMAMQSETLGGKISNLKDSFDQLLLAFGQLITKGGFVNESLEAIARTMQMAAGTFQGDKKQGIEAAIAKMKELQAETKRGSKEWILYNDEILALEGALRRVVDAEKKLADTLTNDVKPPIDDQIADVKELIAEWNRAHSIFATKFNPADQIKDKTGGDFLYDSGGMVYMANAASRALEYLNQNLKINADGFVVWQEGVSARTQMAAESFAMDLGPGISGVLTDFASALGRASAGMEDFGTAIMESLGGFMQQFGGALIALGIGKISLEKFGGPAMIAAGAVLAAAGAAVQASAQKAAKTVGSGGGSSSSVSSGSSFRDRAGNIQDSNPQLVTVLKGEDMWIMLQNYQANNRLTHG